MELRREIEQALGFLGAVRSAAKSAESISENAAVRVHMGGLAAEVWVRMERLLRLAEKLEGPGDATSGEGGE